jgi:SAM-dependent methyltransferase
MVKDQIKKNTPMIVRLSFWRIRHLSFWSGTNYFVLFFLEKLILILDKLLGNENAVKCICCGESFSRFVQFLDYDYMAGSSRCPHCGSHQRHRFLHYFLQREILPKYENGILLRFSPERQFDLLIKRYPKLIYFGTDINGGGRRWTPKDGQPSGSTSNTQWVSGGLSFLSDAQTLPLLNESVDLIVSIHVLEHLPSDLQAMAEISRVLSPKGVSIVMVPLEGREYTLEYDKPNPMEYLHYRAYGRDFVERLSLYFDVSVINAKVCCPHKIFEFGSEKIFVCKKK